MLGVSGMLGNSGDGSAAAAAAAAEAEAVFRESAGNGGGGGHVVLGVVPSSGGVVVMSEEERARIEDGDRNSGGTRWPRQETLALLKIRSDMDVAFRDASLKGPLWEDVSRKLAELGYQRSAKKCKEKFENVYKYHRRTKEGRSSKHEGKTYRFFDQLEALETPPTPFPSLNPRPRPQTHPAPPAAAVASQMPVTSNSPFVSPISTSTTVPSTENPTNTSAFNPLLLSTLPPQPPPPPPPVVLPATAVENPNPINFSYSNSNHNIPSSYPNMSVNIGSISSPSSTSSDEEPERRGSRKRKYWSEFFQRLMNEVIVKQEEMQKRLLETLEKRELERVAREEAWRVQEMSRMNREHDRLVQERSLAAAKDAAVIAFLQKVSEQEIPNGPQMQMHMKMQVPAQPQANPAPPAPPVVLQPPVQAQPPQQQVLQTPPPPPPPPQPQPQVQVQVHVQPPVKGHDNQTTNNGGENFLPASSSRWPKAEVEALIRLRTNMDTKYQENGPKGPLWEEISAAMRKIGYDRNAKRCKEKWENINKYFKKVKESNKKRPEDSKTCPYFHQLDALYKEKTNSTEISTNSFSPGFNMKFENPMAAPILMVQPEQQWPLQQEQHQHQHQLVSGLEDEHDSENTENDEMSEEDEAGGYEIVTNKQPSAVVSTQLE